MELLYQPGKPCLGRNLNYALRQTNGEFVFYVQDDWLLESPLDLDDGIQLLQRESDKYSIIRYHWPQKSLLKRSREVAPGFVQLPEVEYLYSHNPYLASRKFFSQVGEFYERENSVNERKMDRTVRDLCLPVLARVPSVFEHCGQVSTLGDRWLYRMSEHLHVTDRHRQAYGEQARASEELLTEIRRLLLKYRPRRILELGPGLSSFLFLIYQNRQHWYEDFRYLSIDHVNPYHETHLRHLRKLGHTTENFVAVPLHDNLFYDSQAIFEAGVIGPEERFDFVFVDGPPKSARRSCNAAKRFLRRVLDPAAIVVVDDTHRRGEQDLVQWLCKRNEYRVHGVLDAKNPPRSSYVLIAKNRKKATPLPRS